MALNEPVLDDATAVYAGRIYAGVGLALPGGLRAPIYTAIGVPSATPPFTSSWSNSRNLCLEHAQLGAESGETCARNLGHPFVTGIGDHPEQFRDTIASDPARQFQTLQDGRGSHWITAVCWRMKRWPVRWSIRQLCCSGIIYCGIIAHFTRSPRRRAPASIA
jgi:hypothetical protein